MVASAETATSEFLIYDEEAVAAAEALVICIPGALTCISMFDAVAGWRVDGWEPVYYPFPGLDGRALTPPLNIVDAAAEIVAFARRYRSKRICVIGFSTGGAIALTTAAALPPSVKVAGMAPALPKAGGWRTGLSIARALSGAALRARSLAVKQVWLEYYRVLLFGRSVLRYADTARRSDEITSARVLNMVFPERAILRTHTQDLKRWKGPVDPLPNPRNVRFFTGSEDPVFSPAQTAEFAAKLGVTGISQYAGHGHLLFLSAAQVFDDIRAFFEAPVPRDDVPTGNSD